MLIPLLPDGDPGAGPASRGPACGAGDLLRAAARTPARRLPRPRRLSAHRDARAWRPALRADGLRGGLLSWDGQLEDDARLVIAIARTAAGARRPGPHPDPGAPS